MDLIDAVENGDIQSVRELLDRGADPNSRDDYDNTTLILALINRNGNIEIIRLLLDRGADPNLQNDRGYTVLMNASMFGYTEIVRLLLDRGADPYIRNCHNNTASMIAERHGYNDVATLIRDHIRLQKARQRLAFATRLLGDDDDLDYDAMTNVMSKPIRYDPSINIRMMDERLTKARQRLASMRGLSHRDSVFKYLREPQLMKNISEHLSKMTPTPGVQTRLMLEDRQEEPDEDYLRTLNPREREQFLQQRETVRKGGRKRSKQSSRKKRRKNYTRRTRFF